MAGEKESVTTHVYEVYIKAPAQTIWDAITTPEWTARYGYRGPTTYDLRPGGAFRAHATPFMVQMGLPEVIVDGEVIEAIPPSKLVQTYRFKFSEANVAEGFTRITWEIAATQSGFTRLTVTHELEGAPLMAGATSAKFSEQGAGGWSWILSDLKTLLETGKTLGE